VLYWQSVHAWMRASRLVAGEDAALGVELELHGFRLRRALQKARRDGDAASVEAAREAADRAWSCLRTAEALGYVPEGLIDAARWELQSALRRATRERSSSYIRELKPGASTDSNRSGAA